MNGLFALALIAFVLIVTPILGTCSQRRQQRREVYLRRCLQRDRAAADDRVNRHYDTLPDFLDGDSK